MEYHETWKSTLQRSRAGPLDISVTPSLRRGYRVFRGQGPGMDLVVVYPKSHTEESQLGFFVYVVDISDPRCVVGTYTPDLSTDTLVPENYMLQFVNLAAEPRACISLDGQKAVALMYRREKYLLTISVAKFRFTRTHWMPKGFLSAKLKATMDAALLNVVEDDVTMSAA